MNATAPGLLSSLVWVRTLECLPDTVVGDTIADHLSQCGEPVPADELFQNATWMVPSGTELEAPEWAEMNRRSAAPALRVDFSNGLTAVLLVGWSDRCGCGTCQGLPSLRVVEVHRREVRRV